MTGDEVFRALTRETVALDWAGAPSGAVPLADGSTLRFDRRRRSATVALNRGGTLVVNLGAPDRTRAAADLLTPDLVAQPGPDVVLGPTR